MGYWGVVKKLEHKLETVSTGAEHDKDQFLKFAFEFVENMRERFFESTPENRMRCKQIVFPAGFYLDAENPRSEPTLQISDK